MGGRRRRTPAYQALCCMHKQECFAVSYFVVSRLRVSVSLAICSSILKLGPTSWSSSGTPLYSPPRTRRHNLSTAATICIDTPLFLRTLFCWLTCIHHFGAKRHLNLLQSTKDNVMLCLYGIMGSERNIQCGRYQNSRPPTFLRW